MPFVVLRENTTLVGYGFVSINFLRQLLLDHWGGLRVGSSLHGVNSFVGPVTNSVHTTCLPLLP